VRLLWGAGIMWVVTNEAEARVLAQHGGLEKSDPAGVILYMMNGP
jgi:hypothetical protein